MSKQIEYENTKVFYDYRHQAWIEDERYMRCFHPESMDCKCYGKLHEGERASSEIILKYKHLV